MPSVSLGMKQSSKYRPFFTGPFTATCTPGR